MAEHPPEQEEAQRIAETVVASGGFTDVFTNLARAYLNLLAAYEDRSKAFERAAADCVRLEGALKEIAEDEMAARDAMEIARQALADGEAKHG